MSFAQKMLYAAEVVSREGARRCRVSEGFLFALCVFAPLREKYFLAQLPDEQS